MTLKLIQAFFFVARQPPVVDILPSMLERNFPTRKPKVKTNEEKIRAKWIYFGLKSIRQSNHLEISNQFGTHFSRSKLQWYNFILINSHWFLSEHMLAIHFHEFQPANVVHAFICFHH